MGACSRTLKLQPQGSKTHALGLEAIITIGLEAMALRLEAIAIRVEAMAIRVETLGWRPSLLDWRPSLLLGSGPWQNFN